MISPEGLCLVAKYILLLPKSDSVLEANALVTLALKHLRSLFKDLLNELNLIQYDVGPFKLRLRIAEVVSEINL